MFRSKPTAWVTSTPTRSSPSALTVSRSKKLRSTELMLVNYLPIIQAAPPRGQNVCMWSSAFWFQRTLIRRNRTTLAPCVITSETCLQCLCPMGALPLFGNRTNTKAHIPYSCRNTGRGGPLKSLVPQCTVFCSISSWNWFSWGSWALSHCPRV